MNALSNHHKESHSSYTYSLQNFEWLKHPRTKDWLNKMSCLYICVAENYTDLKTELRTFQNLLEHIHDILLNKKSGL